MQYRLLFMLFFLSSCLHNNSKQQENERMDAVHWSDVIQHIGTYTALAGYDSAAQQFYYLSNYRDKYYLDLYHVAIDTGNERLIFQNEGGFVLQEGDKAKVVSPDGDNVVLTKYLSNTLSALYLYSVTNQKYKRLDIPSDSSTTLIPVRFTSDTLLYYLSDYKSKFSKLYKYNTDSDISSEMYQTEGLIEEVVEINENKIVLLINRLTRSELILLDLGKSTEKTIFKEQGYIEPNTLQFDKADDQLKFYYSTPVSPHLPVTLNLHTGQISKIEETNNDLTFESVSFPSENFEIQGFLLWPKNKQQQKLPLCIFIHGGPEMQQPAAYIGFLADIAQSGIAVFVPNIRGSSGFGKTFFHADDRQHHLVAPVDIKNGKDFLLKNYNFLDSGRVYLNGVSYGGYAVYHSLITFPADYSGGIVVNGVVDYYAALTSMPDFFKPIEVMKYGEFGDPEHDRVALREASVLNQADLIKSKLLIFQGKKDRLVSFGTVSLLVEKIDSQYVSFIPLENTGHEINEPEISNMVTRKSIHFMSD